MIDIKKIRVGLIGAGGIGNIHLEGFLENGNCELAAVASRTEEHAKDAAQKFNIPKMYSQDGWKDMLKDENLDVVSICTPNYLHAPMILEAIRNDIHILCEKPICISREELELVENELKKKDLIFFTAFHKRFISYLPLIKKTIESGVLGEIVMSQYFFAHFGPYTSWSPLSMEKWFFDSKKAGGGVLLDLGVHCIDIMSYLIGDYSKIDGFNYKTSRTDLADEDTCNTIFRFKNGALGSIAVSWCTAPSEMINIIGTKGYLLVDFLAEDPFPMGSIDIINSDLINKARKLKSSSENPHHKLINHYIDCVLENKEGRPNFDDGKRAVEFVLDTYSLKS